MIGRNIVLNADEPIVGVGRPLKRIRVRVNNVIVPVESLVVNDAFIFIQLENAVTSGDDVEAQYNPEFVRPVVNGIIAVDNSEELKAFTLTLAQIPIGQVEVDASVGVLSFFAPSGVVVANASVGVEVHGAVLANVSMGVKLAGISEIFVDSSIVVAQAGGPIVLNSSVSAAQNAAVQSIATIDLSQHGVVQVVASMGIKFLAGVVQIDASMDVSLIGEVQITASTAAKFAGEVQLAMAVEVLQNGVVQVAASIEVKKDRIYTVNFSDGDVREYDASTLVAIGADIPVGAFPIDIAFSADKLTAWVTYGSAGISNIDLVTKLVIQDVTLSAPAVAPTRIVLHPTKPEYWITTRGGAGTLEVRSSVDNSFISNTILGIAPRALVILVDGSKGYITDDAGTGQVWVVDGGTRLLITTISVGVGGEARGIALSPDQTKLYVGGQATNDVTIINTATDLVTGQIDFPGGPSGVWGVVFHPNGNFAYAGDQSVNLIREIDATTDTLTGRTVVVAATPRGITISPDGQKLYIASHDSDLMTAIDTATMTVVDTGATGDGPTETHFL